MFINKMPDDKLAVAELALAAHMTTDAFARIVHSPHAKWLLDEPSFNSGLRFFSMEEAVNVLSIAGLTRGGISLPTAAGWMVSVREQLLFYPSDTVNIECRRNGRAFAFVTDDAPEAAVAAGPALFRLTIDLGGYRAMFRDALAARRPADRAAA